MAESEQSGWRWDVKAGIIAAFTCLVCTEAVTAGSTRPCMSSFNLEGILSWTLTWNLFVVPEVMVLLSGVPAFVIASYPGPLNVPTWVSAVLAVAVLLVGYLFPTFKSHAEFVYVFAFVLMVAGAVIGYWVRTASPIRRFGFPFAIVLALSLGTVIFATGHYGPIACLP